MNFNQPSNMDDPHTGPNAELDHLFTHFESKLLENEASNDAVQYSLEDWYTSSAPASSSVPVTWPMRDTARIYGHTTTQARQPTDPRAHYPSPSTSFDGSTRPAPSYGSSESYQRQTHYQGWPMHPGPSTSGIMGIQGNEGAGPSAHPTSLNTPRSETPSSRTSWPQPYSGHPYFRPTMTPPPAQSAPFNRADAISFGQPITHASRRASRAHVGRTEQAVRHSSSTPTLSAPSSGPHGGSPMRALRASDRLVAETVVHNGPMTRGATARTDNAESLPVLSGSRPYPQYNAATPFPPYLELPSLLPAPGSGQQRVMGEPSVAETVFADHQPPHPQFHRPEPSQPERRVAGSSRVLRSTTQAGRLQVTQIDSSFESSGGCRKRKQRDDDEDAEECNKRSTRKRKAGPSILATRASTKGKERADGEAVQIGGKKTARAPKTRKHTAQPRPDNDHDYVNDIPGMPRVADVDVVPGMPGYVQNKVNKKRWGCLPGCTRTLKASKDHAGGKIPSAFNRQVDRNRHFHTVNSHKMDRELNTQHACPFAGCTRVLSRQDALKRHLGRTHELPPLLVQRYMQESEEEEYPRAKRPGGGNN